MWLVRVDNCKYIFFLNGAELMSDSGILTDDALVFAMAGRARDS